MILSYHLVAYAPWEGVKVSITGTKGRIESDVVEQVNFVVGKDAANSGASGEKQDLSTSKGPFKHTSLRVFPMFGEGYEVEVIMGEGGGHGGADPVLLEQLFVPDLPADPFNRAASHIDGAASIMFGIAANELIKTGQLVHINDLFNLPQKNK